MARLLRSLRTFRAAIAHWGITEYALLLVLWGCLSAPLYLLGWGVFSVLSLPLMLAAGAGLTWLAQRFLARAPALDDHRSHVVSFATRLGISEWHGTLSYIAGSPRATWTEHAGGKTSTTDASLSRDEFSRLWNGARRLHQLRPFEIANPQQPIDLDRCFVVSTAFTDAGQTYVARYAIPHGCTQPRVAAWVRQIQANIPTDSSR
jgi:hypothetical protein